MESEVTQKCGPLAPIVVNGFAFSFFVWLVSGGVRNEFEIGVHWSVNCRLVREIILICMLNDGYK